MLETDIALTDVVQQWTHRGWISFMHIRDVYDKRAALRLLECDHFRLIAYPTTWEPVIRFGVETPAQTELARADLLAAIESLGQGVEADCVLIPHPATKTIEAIPLNSFRTLGDVHAWVTPV